MYRALAVDLVPTDLMSWRQDTPPPLELGCTPYRPSGLFTVTGNHRSSYARRGALVRTYVRVYAKPSQALRIWRLDAAVSRNVRCLTAQVHRLAKARGDQVLDVEDRPDELPLRVDQAGEQAVARFRSHGATVTAWHDALHLKRGRTVIDLVIDTVNSDPRKLELRLARVTERRLAAPPP
jgi:hypothetical protein